MDSGPVRLRPVRAGDLEVLFAQQNDPGAAQWQHWEKIQHWQKRVLGDPTARARVVTVAGTAVAGTAVAGIVVAWWQDGRRMVGLRMSPGFHERGLGTRALSAFLGAGQEETRPLYAAAALHDVPTIQVLKHCGFGELEVVRDGPDEFVVLKLA